MVTMLSKEKEKELKEKHDEIDALNEKVEEKQEKITELDTLVKEKEKLDSLVKKLAKTNLKLGVDADALKKDGTVYQILENSKKHDFMQVVVNFPGLEFSPK